MMLSAKDIVTNTFPPDEGARLAQHLLSNPGLDWSDLSIDMRDLPSSLLISAFFNSFLQVIFDEKPELLPAARSVDWQVKFDFQRESVRAWMNGFKPFAG